MSAVSADIAYATTGSSGTGLGSRDLLRRTAAGGWALVSTTNTGFNANSLDAYDADHLVMVGDLGKVYYTANATAATPTWIARATTASTNNLYGVQMTGPDSWIVVGGNETIVRFANAGVSQAGSYGLTNPVPVIVAPSRASRGPSRRSTARPPTRA